MDWRSITSTSHMPITPEPRSNHPTEPPPPPPPTLLRWSAHYSRSHATAPTLVKSQTIEMTEWSIDNFWQTIKMTKKNSKMTHQITKMLIHCSKNDWVTIARNEILKMADEI
jgi:hypothetical protein